jgi:hypothetical protein
VNYNQILLSLTIRLTNPPEAVEALSVDLAPSLYNKTMPAYAIEFKSSNSDMKEAKLQCAFDGSIMTEGARGAPTSVLGSQNLRCVDLGEGSGNLSDYVVGSII